MLPILALLFVSSSFSLHIDRNNCGTSKVCYLKPRGCDPNLDCTLGIMLSVPAQNLLKVELVAQSLVPAVPLQYMAVGFSNDQRMGDDAVTECVITDNGDFQGGGEVFMSSNRGKTNDRIKLSEAELATVISNVTGWTIDGRLYCTFNQQLRPQSLRSSYDGRIWDLDRPLYILAATGSAQPDEVNNHDTNRESFYYPIITPSMIDPSNIGRNGFSLPPSVLDGNRVAARPVSGPSRFSQTASSSFPFLPLLLLLLSL